MSDTTYNKDEIRANPEWDLAFSLSEIQNDHAPIGWSKYIWVAECLLGIYTITRRPEIPAVESFLFWGTGRVSDNK